MSAIPSPKAGGWYRRRCDGAVRWVEALARCVITGQELVIYSRQGAPWGEAEVEPLEEFVAFEPETDWPRWEPAEPPRRARVVRPPQPWDWSEE